MKSIVLKFSKFLNFNLWHYCIYIYIYIYHHHHHHYHKQQQQQPFQVHCWIKTLSISFQYNHVIHVLSTNLPISFLNLLSDLSSCICYSVDTIAPFVIFLFDYESWLPFLSFNHFHDLTYFSGQIYIYTHTHTHTHTHMLKSMFPWLRLFCLINKKYVLILKCWYENKFLLCFLLPD